MDTALWDYDLRNVKRMVYCRRLGWAGRITDLMYEEHNGTAKTGNFEINIPRKWIARPHCQCPHSCVCEQFMYFQDHSAARKYEDLRKYINRSHTHECGNWDTRPCTSFSGNTQMGFSLQCRWFRKDRPRYHQRLACIKSMYGVLTWGMP